MVNGQHGVGTRGLLVPGDISAPSVGRCLDLDEVPIDGRQEEDRAMASSCAIAVEIGEAYATFRYLGQPDSMILVHLREKSCKEWRCSQPETPVADQRADQGLAPN
jgi:hypothetical protein